MKRTDKTNDDAPRGSLSSYGPGKFSLLVDALAYDLSLAGCDDEAGESELGSGWYGLLKGPIQADGPFGDIVPQWSDKLALADLAFLAEQRGGVILNEDSQGFVSCEWFTTAEACAKAWEAVVSETSDDQGEL